MPDPFQEHATEVALVSYALGDLADSETAQVEEHLLVCEACRQVVLETDAFGRLFGDNKRGHAAVAFAHATGEGLVSLELSALPGSRWLARIRGGELEAQAVLASPREAYRHLRRSFSEMFPEHLCSPECGPARPLP
jgi:anti-sigma factor RsiW